SRVPVVKDIAEEDGVVASRPGVIEHVERMGVDAVRAAESRDVGTCIGGYHRQLGNPTTQLGIPQRESDRIAARSAGNVQQPVYTRKVAITGQSERGWPGVAVHALVAAAGLLGRHLAALPAPADARVELEMVRAQHLHQGLGALLAAAGARAAQHGYPVKGAALDQIGAGGVCQVEARLLLYDEALRRQRGQQGLDRTRRQAQAVA